MVPLHHHRGACGGFTFGGQSARLLEYLRHCLVKYHVAGPFLLQYKVCAVYTLYSMYTTQICRPKVRIRLSPDLWTTFLEVEDRSGPVDVGNTLDQLARADAFQIIAEAWPQCSAGLHRDKAERLLWVNDPHPGEEEPLSEERLHKLGTFLDEYVAKKQQLPIARELAYLEPKIALKLADLKHTHVAAQHERLAQIFVRGPRSRGRPPREFPASPRRKRRSRRKGTVVPPDTEPDTASDKLTSLISR